MRHERLFAVGFILAGGGRIGSGQWYVSYGMGRPRDDRNAVQDLARELADLAAQLAALKGEAYNWLSALEYAALRHRLEDAHASVEAAAVEARRRVRLSERRER